MGHGSSARPDPSPITHHPSPDGGGSAAIRFGLAGIKGVGEQAAQKILEEREKNGPYRNFRDFMLRVDARALNKRVLENLIATGGFDFSGAGREELFGQIDDVLSVLGELQRKYPALRKDVPVAKSEEPAESMLFDLGEASAPAALPDRDRLIAEFGELLKHTRRAPINGNGPGKPAADDHMFDLGAGPGSGPGKAAAKSAAAERKVLTADNLLQFEKELLGFYVSGHPMNTYEGLAEAINTYAIEELLLQGDRVEFRLCGIAGNIVKRLSKKDNRPWAMFTLATKRGSVGLNIFADGYEAYGRSLVENATVLVQGNIIVNQEGPRINVKEIYPLDGQIAGIVKKVTWLLRPEHPALPDFLRQLRETLNRQAGDTKVFFGFVFPDRIAPIAEASNALSWKMNAPAFQTLRAHPAVAGVQLETRPVELKEDRRWKKRA